MSMVQIRYRSKRTGGVIVYEYAPPESSSYTDAATSCWRAIKRNGALYRMSKERWRAAPNGRRFRTVTVMKLIEAGKAVIDGDVVRRAA